jgi:16S rRNA (cytidine1402-2'-O)-methyltransferase
VVRPWPAKPLPPVRIWVPPLLYLIATPIGNLADFSARACQTIAECDYLICEDTRTSGILLSHYELKKPLKSFHLHNEKKMTEKVLKDLESGMTIGLLSDAGTPTLSDPGALLVDLCYQRDLVVSPIPGPCAAIAALTASGLNPARFQFLGFLPRRPSRTKKMIEEALAYPGTSIIYESPHRVVQTLKIISGLSPDRPVVVAREITKKFETFVRGPALELYETYLQQPPKGECVILIAEN